MELVGGAFSPDPGVVERSPRAGQEPCFLELWKGTEQEDPETVRRRARVEAFSRRLTRVTDFLWQSGIPGAQEERQLARCGITHVLSLLCEDEMKTLKLSPRVASLRIQMADSCAEPVYPVLVQALAFIREAAQAGGVVLVHCSQGVSRSSVVVIAYLERYFGLTFAEALEYLKSTRPVVAPNAHFSSVLQEYGARLRNTDEQKATMEKIRST